MAQNQPMAELSWKRADYEAAGQEVPERLLSSPEACEGLLMSEEELAEYLHDGVATVKVLLDKGAPQADKVFLYFKADLEFLVSIGRLSLDDYNELITEDNFRF